MRRAAIVSLAVTLALCGASSAAVKPDRTPLGRMTATSTRGMVVTEQHLASDVGAQILREGGNAVDAAVAIGYALAVTDPCCGNIGGGGFMLVRLAGGKEAFIDFREKAPLAATADMYLDSHGAVRPGLSTDGYLATGVPGTVMGLEYARVHYGTMSRQRLMAPAISLAEHGFVLEASDAEVIADHASRLGRDAPAAQSLLVDGKPPNAGATLVQRDLADTLAAIARDGPSAFYNGAIARDVVAASESHGGILTLRDFETYSVTESAPVHCSYRGYDVAAAPPPSSGGTTLCEILGILESYPLGRDGSGSSSAVHLTIEAERRAFADRNAYLGDPAFVHNPVEMLLSKAYLARWRATIGPNATPSREIGAGAGNLNEHAQTTHYSIVDSRGNAVGVTYTLNDTFGAAVMAPHTGFLLNDEMDDFTSKPGAPNMYGLVQGVRNAIAPGKRPLSSMTPTIVTKDGKLFLVLGSPGGPRIITTVLQVFQGVVDYGMTLNAAVAAPRIHEQWLPESVFIENGALTTQVISALRARGYTFTIDGPWSVAEAIEVNAASGALTGVADARRASGSAAAP